MRCLMLLCLRIVFFSTVLNYSFTVLPVVLIYLGRSEVGSKYNKAVLVS